MSFQNVSPDQLQDIGQSTMRLAHDDSQQRGDGPVNALMTVNGTLFLVGAQILDRLERILTLLDERLPPRQRDTRSD